MNPGPQKAIDAAAAVTSLAFWGVTLADAEILVRIAVGIATFVSLCLLCAVYVRKLRSKS